MLLVLRLVEKTHSPTGKEPACTLWHCVLRVAAGNRLLLSPFAEVAWENSRRFATSPLASPRNDLRVTGEETPYLRRVTTLIFWTVKTIFSCGTIAIRGSSQWVVRHISMEFLRSFRETSGGVAKCGLVSHDMSRTGYFYNWPFQSSPGPLFQNEGRCSSFDMEIIFHSHANITHFQKKSCAPSLILKVRVFRTRKWPICLALIKSAFTIAVLKLK